MLARDILKGGKSGCKAVDCLFGIMEDLNNEPRDRTAATKLLMAYAYGAPKNFEPEENEMQADVVVLVGAAATTEQN